MHDDISSIMIIGSHILFEHNGIKLYSPDGEITKADQQLILNSNFEVDSQLRQSTEGLVLPEVNQTAVNYYIKRYIDIYSQNLKKTQMHRYL